VIWASLSEGLTTGPHFVGSHFLLRRAERTRVSSHNAFPILVRGSSRDQHDDCSSSSFPSFVALANPRGTRFHRRKQTISPSPTLLMRCFCACVCVPQPRLLLVRQGP
jgi:hypothetical protein